MEVADATQRGVCLLCQQHSSSALFTVQLKTTWTLTRTSGIQQPSINEKTSIYATLVFISNK